MHSLPTSTYLLSNLGQYVNYCNYGTINRQDFVLKVTFSVGNSCIIQKYPKKIWKSVLYKHIMTERLEDLTNKKV